MRVSTRELQKMVERWEHEKPLLVVWTDEDERILSACQELLKIRKYHHQKPKF